MTTQPKRMDAEGLLELSRGEHRYELIQGNLEQWPQPDTNMDVSLPKSHFL